MPCLRLPGPALLAALIFSLIVLPAVAAVSILSADWTADSDQQSAQLGYAVAAAGDVNGDGFADALVGAPKYDAEAYRGGAAFVYHGSSGGLAAVPAWTAGSSQQGSEFGAALAAGDFNGDGLADVLVGARDYKNDITKVGAVFAYTGAPGGLGAAPAWSYLSSQKESLLGCAVAAGDVNGDGYADALVGAPNFAADEMTGGAVLLFYGSAAGLQPAPGWQAAGGQPAAQFGAAVAAGDVNGDGYADILVGAPTFDTADIDTGAAFLFYGAAAGPGAIPGWQTLGAQAGAQFGRAVAAGDVNGDGYADILAGAPYFDTVQENDGAALAFYGAAAGPGAAPAWQVSSNQSGAAFGAVVAAAGDFNGDGLADALVGAPRYSGGQSAEGAIFVYRGHAAGLEQTPAWQAEGNKADADFGFAAAAGDVNRDGYADILAGAPTYKRETVLYGRAFAFYGAENAGSPQVSTVYLPVVLKLY